MPQAWGLSAEGFKAKDLQSIKTDLEAQMRQKVDPTLHFGPGSIAGILTAIVANQARQVWEVAHGLYHSLQADTATGSALDALCRLTGTTRRKAAYSKAKVMVTLDSKTALPKDSRIQTIGGHFFKATAGVENTETTADDIEVDFIAEEVGPIMAHKDTIATIMTPTRGWSKAVIKRTCETGQFDETDDDLRRRRIDELNATGSSTADAVRQRLKRLDQVEAVLIKENECSFEVVIQGGEDQDIANTIWQCKPLGIDTAGKVECMVTDSIKETRVIRFSRPEPIHFSLDVRLKVRRKLEQNEIDAIKNSLVDFSVKNFKLGDDVYQSRFYSVALNHPEVLDVAGLMIKKRSPGRYTVIEINPDQIASLSFSDIRIDTKIVEVGV